MAWNLKLLISQSVKLIKRKLFCGDMLFISDYDYCAVKKGDFFFEKTVELANQQKTAEYH